MFMLTINLCVLYAVVFTLVSEDDTKAECFILSVLLITLILSTLYLSV